MTPWRLAVAALLLAGCAVDDRDISAAPQPIVVDTFENGTLVPPDQRFNRWQSTVYSTDIAERTYQVVQPGFDSGWSLQLAWDFSDSRDGVRNYPDALIRTQAIAGVDLTSFKRFTFAVRTDPGQDSRVLQLISVALACSELATEFAMVTSVGPDWQEKDLPLQSFGEPNWTYTGAKWEDCLSRVDEIQFVTSYALEDGEHAAGTLYLDDIAIR